jgi:cell division protein FtsB
MHYFFKQKDVVNVGVLIVLLLVVVYYSYYISKTSEQIAQLNEEVAILRETFFTVSVDYDRLENNVSQLRKDNMSLELLDERARSVLGYIRPDERLILNNE